MDSHYLARSGYLNRDFHWLAKLNRFARDGILDLPKRFRNSGLIISSPNVYGPQLRPQRAVSQ